MILNLDARSALATSGGLSYSVEGSRYMCAFIAL